MAVGIKFAAAQTLEKLARGQVPLTAGFDEFILIAEIAYHGEPMPMPIRRPNQCAFIADPDAARLVAAGTLRRDRDRAHRGSDGLCRASCSIADGLGVDRPGEPQCQPVAPWNRVIFDI